MKKKVSIVLVLLFLLIGCIALVGCNNKGLEDRLNKFDDKISELENNNAELENNNNNLESKVTALETRLAKVEKTIAALQELSGSGTYPELLAAISKVRDDLLANTATDAEIKAQVTEMQKKVDQIRFDNDNPVNLTQTQEMLNALYGQTNPPVHKNGDTFDVGLNGVTYYTVTFYGEVHEGIVNTATTDVMPKCPGDGFHMCGRITIENKMRRSITGGDMGNLIQPVYPTSSGWISLKLKSDGTRPQSIAAGEKIDLHFACTMLKQSNINQGFDMVFNIATANLGDGVVYIAGAVIPNFYKP